MTNEERWKKLRQAEDIIREVEFSYPLDSDERLALYRAVVMTLGFGGPLRIIIDRLARAELAEDENDTLDKENSD